MCADYEPLTCDRLCKATPVFVVRDGDRCDHLCAEHAREASVDLRAYEIHLNRCGNGKDVDKDQCRCGYKQ